jgi:hypothetical protein
VLQPKVGQTVLVLVEPTALPEPAGEMTARSKDFGEAFRKWSHPRSEHITSLFASLTETVLHIGESENGRTCL